MKQHGMLRRKIRLRAALLLAAAMAFQSTSYAMGDIFYRETATAQLSSENTSFASFPSRFEDTLPDGYEEAYYIFSLDSLSDLTISVEFDEESSPYGAELLDSSLSTIGRSRNRNGQRIVKKDVQAGTYFLRVFAMEETEGTEPFAVSIQKMDLSDSSVKGMDLSELHMVAALQGTDSPYQMNGTSPYYEYETVGVLEPVFWRKLDTPSYSGRGVNSGGTYPMPQSYYASWLGPVAEDVLPMDDIRDLNGNGESYEEYDKYLQEDGITYEGEEKPLFHVQNGIALPARYLSLSSDGGGEENPGWEDHLKNAIMTYGAVTTGIYWGNLECEEPENYYFSGWDYFILGQDEHGETIYTLANRFDLGDMAMVNHEVVIVGWDDNYPRENFRYKIDRKVELLPTATDGNADYIVPETEPATRMSRSLLATDGNADYEEPEDEWEDDEDVIWDNGPEDSEENFPLEVATPSNADYISRDTVKNSETDAELEELLDSLIPERDGAWIVRNSWGDGAGDDGYYYVSYCDKRIVSNENSWAYTATETSGNYNKMYQVTGLPYSAVATWTTAADMLMTSTVFTAEEEGADVLKAVTFDLLNNNVQYEIAVNQGDDVGKGWIEENVCASGSKMYAGYYTVRLDKTILLEPGEKFEIILKIEHDGSETLAVPMVMNDTRVANLPRQEGICFLHDPVEAEEWIDMGDGYMPDNGGSNYYAYFSLKALCYDASLEEGETKRISALETDPDTYFSLIDSESVDSETEEPKEDFSDFAEETYTVRDGHILQSRKEPVLQRAVSVEELDITLPESFDLRDVGVLTPVKDQRLTNTCWAFGSTAAVESSYLLNGSNLYDFNYSSGISLDSELPLSSDAMLVYYFDKNDPDTMENGRFSAKLLSWDNGPVEDEGEKLRWEFSGDLSAADFTGFDLETGGTRLTESGEEVLLFTPEESGLLTVKVSSVGDPTKTASCQIVLVEQNEIDRISISPESMRLRVGSSQRIQVTLEGAENSEIVPVFSSDNPGIASVGADGTVIGLSEGTTVIRVRAGDKEAVCRVTVWENGSYSDDFGGDDDFEWDDDFRELGDSGAVRGEWIMAEDGSWSFAAGGKVYRDTWGYLYNPYGNQGLGNAGWYRFDAEGKLVTGWFLDTDGHWYYLNPVSDGDLGKMVTGWQWIADPSGREYCYYFYQDVGAPFGSMAANTVTPDGFQVNDQGRWCEESTEQTR